MAKWERFELRLSEDQLTVVKRTAQVRGFRSVSGYIQAVLTEGLARFATRPIRPGSIRRCQH